MSIYEVILPLHIIYLFGIPIFLLTLQVLAMTHEAIKFLNLLTFTSLTTFVQVIFFGDIVFHLVWVL